MVLSQMVLRVTVHTTGSKRSSNTIALSKNSLNSNLNIVFHAKFGESTRLLSIGKRFSSSTGLIGGDIDQHLYRGHLHLNHLQVIVLYE